MSELEVNGLRRLIINAAVSAGEGHIASAFSVLDILYVLYDRVLKLKPWAERDYFILSKGHASLALYAVLAHKGIFPKDNLSTFCQKTSNFGGHPHRLYGRGIEASTGSLGHGLPIAVGIAKALKIQKKPNRVFCVVGDGECNEGSIWEAAQLAAQHKLDNLRLIVDHNKSGERAIALGHLPDKFMAFGWIATMIDGHNHGHIKSSCQLESVQGMPYVLVADTIKGKGVSTMEKEPHAWHHRVPNTDELAAFNYELDENAKRICNSSK